MRPFRELELVGARGFEPLTFRSRNDRRTVADRTNPFQPSEIITDTEAPEVQPSQPLPEKTNDFVTRFGTQNGDRAGAERLGVRDEGGAGEGRLWWLTTEQLVATTPTLADLAVLYGGRGRLLKIAEVAEQLGVCAATVYRLCETGELPHFRIVNSIRIRPDDLKELLAQRRKGRARVKPADAQ